MNIFTFLKNMKPLVQSGKYTMDEVKRLYRENVGELTGIVEKGIENLFKQAPSIRKGIKGIGLTEEYKKMIRPGSTLDELAKKDPSAAKRYIDEMMETEKTMERISGPGYSRELDEDVLKAIEEEDIKFVKEFEDPLEDFKRGKETLVGAARKLGAELEGDETVAELQEIISRLKKADGGRIGLKEGGNERFLERRMEDYMEEGLSESEAMEKAIRDLKEGKFIEEYATGGRVGLKDGGMKRRTFLKLAGLGLGSLPFVGKLIKPAAKAAKKLKDIEINISPGMEGGVGQEGADFYTYTNVYLKPLTEKGKKILKEMKEKFGMEDLSSKDEMLISPKTTEDAAMAVEEIAKKSGKEKIQVSTTKMGELGEDVVEPGMLRESDELVNPYTGEFEDEFVEEIVDILEPKGKGTTRQLKQSGGLAYLMGL